MGKRLTTGIGEDGKSRAFAKPGEPTLGVHHFSHGDGDHVRGHAVPGNIARDGAPKAVHGVPIHKSAKRQQIDMAGVGGMGHATAAIDDGGQSVTSSAAAAPLAHAYGSGVPKIRGPAPVGWNQKNVCGPVAKSLDDATPHDIRGQMLLDQRKV
jgi:hypothetical protein